MIRSVEDLGCHGKSVFVRVDFNVPIEHGTIVETHRVRSTLPTRAFLHLAQRVRQQPARVILLENLRFDGGEKANDADFSVARYAKRGLPVTRPSATRTFSDG